MLRNGEDLRSQFGFHVNLPRRSSGFLHGVFPSDKLHHPINAEPIVSIKQTGVKIWKCKVNRKSKTAQFEESFCGDVSSWKKGVAAGAIKVKRVQELLLQQIEVNQQQIEIHQQLREEKSADDGTIAGLEDCFAA